MDFDSLQDISILSLPAAIRFNDFVSSSMEYGEKLVDFFVPIPFNVDSPLLRYAVLPFNLFVFRVASLRVIESFGMVGKSPVQRLFFR